MLPEGQHPSGTRKSSMSFLKVAWYLSLVSLTSRMKSKQNLCILPEILHYLCDLICILGDRDVLIKESFKAQRQSEFSSSLCTSSRWGLSTWYICSTPQIILIMQLPSVETDESGLCEVGVEKPCWRRKVHKEFCAFGSLYCFLMLFWKFQRTFSIKHNYIISIHNCVQHIFTPTYFFLVFLILCSD